MKKEAYYQSIIELLDIFFEKVTVPLDYIVHHYFKERRYIGSSDRRHISTILYEIIRCFFQLEWFSKNDSDSREIVILYLIIIKKLTIKDLHNVFNGQQYTPANLSEQEINFVHTLPSVEDAPQWSKNNTSEWLWNILRKSFGPNISKELEALFQEAPLDLRVNLLKENREIVLKQLTVENIKAEPTILSPLGIRIEKRINLNDHSLLKNGAVEIQDEGSQLVSILCHAQPGMSVMDYCAGAGGKSLAMAAAMNNKGRLVLTDAAEWRLKRAKERLKRAGIFNAEYRSLNDKGWFKRQYQRFDRILLDVPCSGTGTWRRNPDLKIRFNQNSLNQLIIEQQEILNQGAKFVKKGGWLVYATCSLLQEENHLQIKKFLEKYESFSFVNVKDIWEQLIQIPYPCSDPNMLQLTPAQHNTDGFFIAILQNNN